MALTPGTRLGPYEITAPLGAGGMGEVYRARDTRLGRDVAIKVLPQDSAASPEDRARFAREAKSISALNHPHICILHDIGREGETDYLVMELVEGETLAHRIARGALPPGEALRIGAQIADALDRAHRAGVIHRDLKPGNVMLTRSGAKLMDFGLAQRAKRPVGGPTDVTETAQAGTAPTEEPITAKGTVVGTYQYMAPEQLEGKQVDARADLWALGCVLYEMVAGRRAFEGASAASVMSAILRDEPRPLGELSPMSPPALEQVVKACLAKDPEDRIQTAHDVRLKLGWIVEEGSRKGGPSATRKLPRLRARLAWVVAALTVALVGVAWLLRGGQPDDRPAPGEAGFSTADLPGGDLFLSSTPSIAVLPFQDLSPSVNEEYLADGLSEELINVLASVRGLRVVSRTSSFSFKGKTVPLDTIAKQLNVTLVLEGSIRTTGSALRVTAQLIDATNDSHLWSQSYDRSIDDLLAVQEDIARTVVEKVRTTLGVTLLYNAEFGARIARPAKNPKDGPELLRLWMASIHFGRQSSREGREKSLEYRRRGLKLVDPKSPDYLEWQAAISTLEGELGLMPETQAIRKSIGLLERALAMQQPRSSSTMANLGWLYYQAGDLAKAEPLMRGAAALNPERGGLLRGAAVVAAERGRFEEAIEIYNRAVALDPLNPRIHYNFGETLEAVGRYAEAEAEFKKTLELAPGARRVRLAMLLLGQGRTKEALTEARMEPDEDWRLYVLTLVLDQAGRGGEADSSLRALIRLHGDDMAYQIAELYGARGNADSAFKWLERARTQEDGGLIETQTSPHLRSLHSDPRWTPFLRKIGVQTQIR